MVAGKARSRALYWSIGSGLVVACIVVQVDAGVAQTSAPPADEDGAAEPVTETPDPRPDDLVPGEPEHDPFEMFPADQGALTWDDLSDDDRAIEDAAQEWHDLHHGAEVHNAFSAAVQTTSALRQTAAAAHEAGLDGFETLGVVP